MAKDDTSEYSSSKAPETRREAEEPESFSDTRLIPGGAQPRTDTQQGMAGLDREQTPRANPQNPAGKLPED